MTPPMSRARVASGALCFDPAGRVLLVKPTYKEGWEIPGGYVEPGETPIAACEREVREELGLDRNVRKLLVVDWAPSEKEGDKILFVFDGGVLAEQDQAAISLPADELERYDFFPDSELPSVLIERLARRVGAALEARHRDETAYLEHGRRSTTGESDWWTTDEVAAYLDVSASTVRAYVARNQMPDPDRRVGRVALWRPETIHAWHDQRPRKVHG